MASETTARGLIRPIDETRLKALRCARAEARGRAWDAGARPKERIVGIDATLLSAHSEKEGAGGTYKNGSAFHPLPTADLAREILAPPASAGGTHALTSDCRETRIRFSVGYEVDVRVRNAIVALPESAWQEAIEADGSAREAAWVSELSDLDLRAWPEGTPPTGRRGHRRLELRHRRRARVEDAIGCARKRGCATCPSPPSPTTRLAGALAPRLGVLAWASFSLPRGALALSEPKRPLHLARRIVRSGRLTTRRPPPHSKTRRACFAAQM